MANPGFPGGPVLNWDSIPVTPDGPDPVNGILAQDKIIPAGTKHYLSTLSAPRKKGNRIPPDEFSLIAETYNQKFGTNIPTNPMDPAWKAQWVTREAISKVATGRWNAYMCTAGKGHCAHPGMLAWIGRAIHAATKVLGKISKFAGPLLKMIPGIGNIASAMDTVASIGGQIVAGSKILSAGVHLVGPAGVPGFNLGAALLHSPNLTPDILQKARSKLITPQQKLGFDMAVSMSSGIGTSKAPVNLSAMAKAGYYATQGMQGADPDMQTGMLKEVSSDPEAKKGAVIAAKEIKDKTLWVKIKEFVGIYQTDPAATAAASASVKVAPKAKGKFGSEYSDNLPFQEFEEGFPVETKVNYDTMSELPYKEFDLGIPLGKDDFGLEGDSSVRSPTSTRTEVRSPTRTSTEVRSPTRTATSTEAYTSGNFTATVTGGAGAGATSVNIYPAPNTSRNFNTSKSKEREPVPRQTDIDSEDSMNGDCHIGTRMNEGI